MKESIESFATEHPMALTLFIGIGALAAVFGYRAWQQTKEVDKNVTKLQGRLEDIMHNAGRGNRRVYTQEEQEAAAKQRWGKKV